MEFAKYHGCGNNFIIMAESQAEGMDYSLLAQKVCSQTIGIGADGLILVRTEPVLEMVFYNQDGSRAPMCGNGIRCFAAFCHDQGICRESSYPVRTLAGTMVVEVLQTEPFQVKIKMGKPDFTPEHFGVYCEENEFLNRELETTEGAFTVNSLFMGTVHTVVWVDEFPSEEAGRQLSNHPVFTEKTNVNFVKVKDRRTLEIQTYERGVGITAACGTGCCASLVTGALQGKCEKAVSVLLPYGQLEIEQLEDGEVTMAGPAVRVADGIYLGGTKQ